MMNTEQLKGMITTEGFKDATIRNHDWDANFKAEALIGIKHFRVGYRFMYMHVNGPTVAADYTPVMNGQQYTTYFNTSYTNIFAHYGVIEIPLINITHFALTPGVAIGGYTGSHIDKTTGDKVQLTDVGRYRFTVGAELNFEIKFGRAVIFFGPNYYMFNLQDKVNRDWHQYSHSVGADLGLRVNLLSK